VITVSSSTPPRENEPGADPQTFLRLSQNDDSTPAAPQIPASTFSSLQQTALALVSVASEQAFQRASNPAGPGVDPDLRPEPREIAIQRATAEQARRAADCLRTAFEAMVDHILQPCLVMDDSGCIVKWNAALSTWTGVAEADAINLPLSAVFASEAAAEIAAAHLALREAEDLSTGNGADPVFSLDGRFVLNHGPAALRVSMLPLCRLPRIVESVIVLLTPELPA